MLYGIVILCAVAGPGGFSQGEPLHPSYQLADTRPLVIVYSLEWERPDLARACPPCLRLYNESRQPGFPWRLEWRKPVEWVDSVPVLHWHSISGSWHKQVGWSNLESFRYSPATMPK